MRFLLVEDNVELARLLTAGLVAQGLAADVVETAADARLALGSIRSRLTGNWCSISLPR
jgi:DNA-binding response OmpR family regulator